LAEFLKMLSVSAVLSVAIWPVRRNGRKGKEKGGKKKREKGKRREERGKRKRKGFMQQDGPI
jgi:hypothetical protein